MHKSRLSSRWGNLATVIVGFVAGAALLVLLDIQPADAAPCENANYNVQAQQNTNLGQQQGIRTDLWFATGNNDCNRISGVHVLYGTNGFVEWSWVLGYSSCNGQFYSTPQLFRYWRPNNGSLSCAVDFGNAPGNFFQVTLKDENSNTVWGAYKSGTLIATMNVNFDRGTMGTNGERDCTCDSAYSHFKTLKYQVVGSQTWNSWTNAVTQADTDPGYKNRFNSNTNIEVVQQ